MALRRGPVVVAHWRKGPCGTQLCGAHGACVDCVLWHTVCLLYVCNQLHPRLRQNLKHHNQALELASWQSQLPPRTTRGSVKVLSTIYGRCVRSAWLGQFLGRQRLTQPQAHRCSHNCWARVHHRFTDHAIITAAHAIARTTANFQCIAAHATTELLHTQSHTLALATGTARTMLLFNGRQSHACDTTATRYATYIHLSSRIMGGMLSRSGKLRRLTWPRGPRPTAKFKIGRKQPSFSHCSCLASTSSSPPIQSDSTADQENLGVAEAGKSVGMHLVSESPFEVR